MEEASSGIRAVVVEPKDLPHIWDRVAEHLGPACDRSFGQETLYTARRSIITGKDGLFIVLDGDEIIGALTYRVSQYDTGLRILDIQIGGGVNMEAQMPTIVQMYKDLQASLLCDRVRINGRKGWIRYMKKYGFVEKYHSVETE